MICCAMLCGMGFVDAFVCVCVPLLEYWLCDLCVIDRVVVKACLCVCLCVFVER